jgi:protein-disulfide isomerase
VTLVLTRIASLPSLLHVWVVVLAANVIGAGAAAYFFAKTGILEPGIAEAARAYGLTALERPWMDLFWRALFAGGLVATMVWMTHAARETVSRLLLVFLLMFLVPAAHLYHCISGTVEGLFVVFDPVARAPLGSFVWGFFAPVVAGNTVGGLFLVALLNYAQTRKSQFPGRDGPMQLTWPEWLGSFGLTWHAHPGETPVAELADEVDEEQDRILGRPGCPVTLVQYGDYGAPATRLIFELVEEVLEDPETEVSYVYRHLPLKRDHSPSERAAAAAEAAGRQGRFWEMHSQLLRNHDRLDRPHLLEYAQAVDLEMDRFRRDLDDPELLERVLRQRRSGIRSGVRWAANLFINGYRYQGAMEIRGIREAVREASKLRLASEVEEPESHGTD